MHPRTTRLTAAGIGLGAMLVTAGPAAAHVTAGPAEVPAGGFTAVTLTVPHGCEGSPTTQLAVQIPEGINDVTPQVVPGWNIEIDTETLPEPITDAHGNELTERESVVRFIAEPGNELEDGFRQSFTIGFQAPDTPGETLFLESIQTCQVGETAWIEEFDGEREEPEHPAPSVAVVESEGDGHGAPASDDDEAEVAEVDADTAAATTDDDDSSTGIAVAGLVAGALGLVAGGAALVRSRKTSAP